jgi:hypothetical protein
MVLPILVTEVVSAEVNAVFFLGLLSLQVLLLGPASISSALYAISTRDPTERRSRLRFSLLVAVVMCLGEMVAFILLFDFILGLINPAFPTIAGPHMSYIGLAVPARTAKYFYIAIARMDCRMRQGSVLLAVCGVLEVAGAAIGGVTAGSPGLVAGWLVSVYVEMGLLLPSLLAAFARPSRVAATGTTAWPTTARDSTGSGV